jgi:hypothetical protein
MILSMIILLLCIYLTVLIVILHVLAQNDHLYSYIMNMAKMVKVKY